MDPVCLNIFHKEIYMVNEVSTAITSMTTVVGNVFSLLTGNAILMLFVGASVLGAGIGLVRRLSKGRV